MKNRKIFFVSDPHFGHDNIIHYCNRPFKDAHEMNEAIIKRYNYVVQPHDIVYFLGDIGFKHIPECREIIKQLKGIKILILGNHDKWGIMSYYNMGFSAVLQDATIRLGKEWVTMSHYPRRKFREIMGIFWIYIKKMRKRKRPWWQVIQKLKKEWKWTKFPDKYWHINGHVHEKWKVKGKNINVSVDQWNFQPVPFHEIVKIIQNRSGK